MIKDYEIPLPRWELTDPFGRAALRRMRWELKKALCERDGYRVEAEEILRAKANAVDGLMDTLRREQAATDEAKRRFDLAEKARGEIARKNNQLRDELHGNDTTRAQLRVEYEKLREEHEELKKNYARLQEDHEKLLYLSTHKEAEI